MPRGRSPPTNKYVRKRPYFNPSASNIKRPGTMPRQMRTLSRSPHRGRSPPRHRILPSHRSGSPKHDRGIGSSRFAGRPYNRNPRSSVKRSRSPIPRRHSLSPPRKTTKSSPSPLRKSPVGSKHHSVSPSIRRKPSTDLSNSPRRMDVACHRDARYFYSSYGSHQHHPVNTGATKRDYSSPKTGRRSLSPVPRKKEPLPSPTQRRNSTVNNETRLKDGDKYRGGRDFFSSDRIRTDEYLDRHSLEHNREHPANSHIFRSNRNDKYGTKDSDHGRNNSPFNRESRSEIRRYSEGHFDMEYQNDDIYSKRNNDTGLGYPSRDGKPSLDDRYRSGEDVRAFSPEELKKITVDIRRNIPRESELIVRRIVNPEDVVIVRRPGEGARPIFDREEIKHSSLERNEEYLEKRVVAIVPERNRSQSPEDRLSSIAQRSGSGYHENFKIHREKYPSYENDSFQPKQRLSDRWQQDGRDKFGSSQNEKLMVSVRSHSPQVPSNDYRAQASPSGDHYRSNFPSRRSSYYDGDVAGTRYPVRDADDRNRDYDSHRRPLPTNPNDLRKKLTFFNLSERHSLMSRGRPFDVVDARQRILERREKDRDPPLHRMDSRDADQYDGRSRVSDDRLRTGMIPHWQQDKFRDKWDGSPPMGSDGKLPNFASRPDRYQYKEWIDKPDMVPKGPSYFEHDTRGESEFDFSRRGRSRGGVRGFTRGTPFRGRGGIFRGRGRGVFLMNRRGKRSPHQWEHDMFEKMSPDVKMANK